MHQDRTIKLTIHEPFVNNPLINPESFILVRKSIQFYKLNEKYYLNDYNNKLLGVYYLVSIKPFKISEVDSELSFLHKNTTPHVYKQILEYHNFKEKDLLLRMVFTNQKQFSNE
jgi:hypothetical protein